MEESAERILGRLEEATTGLRRDVGQVLTNQDSARADLKAHAQNDADNFAEIKAGLGGLRDRIATVEKISDTVESHGDALLTMEKRLADRDEAEKIQGKLHERDIKWSRGVLGAATAVGAAVGSAGTSIGPALWKYAMAMFGVHKP